MTPNKLRPFVLAFPLLLAVGLVGCGDSGDATQNPIDTVPPAVPVNVTTTSDDTIEVSWQGNSEPDLAGYVLQRSADQGVTWTNVSAAIITTPSWNDPLRSRLDYRVAAVDLSSNQSAFSAPATYVHPTSQGSKIPTISD